MRSGDVKKKSTVKSFVHTPVLSHVAPFFLVRLRHVFALGCLRVGAGERCLKVRDTWRYRREILSDHQIAPVETKISHRVW